MLYTNRFNRIDWAWSLIFLCKLLPCILNQISIIYFSNIQISFYLKKIIYFFNYVMWVKIQVIRAFSGRSPALNAYSGEVKLEISSFNMCTFLALALTSKSWDLSFLTIFSVILFIHSFDTYQARIRPISKVGPIIECA